MGKKSKTKVQVENTKQKEVKDENIVKDTNEEVVETQENLKKGHICDCERLRIRKEPSLESECLYILTTKDEVIVDMSKTVDDFYNVSIYDVTGYSVKDFIEIE